MHRDAMLGRVEDQTEPWDLVVVGGGATGVGIAVDAAARGYQVLLLEARDEDDGYVVCSNTPRMINGEPSKNPRYLQARPLAPAQAPCS